MKKILVIPFAALILVACGGSNDGSSGYGMGGDSEGNPAGQSSDGTRSNENDSYNEDEQYNNDSLTRDIILLKTER